MPTRAFAVEDGNIGLTTILTSRTKSYSDIDLTFTPKASGDIFKKQHGAAVKQAVRNLLLTNFSETPFSIAKILKFFFHSKNLVWSSAKSLVKENRSINKKTDYIHIYDYWKWDEDEINKVLINQYDWETATDTNTTWRIGDGTAAFYNYIY